MPCARSIVVRFLLLLLVGGCGAFSGGGASLAARRDTSRRGVPIHVRHPSPTLLGDFLGRNAAPLTLRWSSPTDSGVQTEPAAKAEPSSSASSASAHPPDLHPPTLGAIAHALLVRAQNVPGMPLRLAADGSMEPWELALPAGKIAQSAAEEWAKENGINPVENDELLQVMAGRVMAVVPRMEELEEELLKRCDSCGDIDMLGRLGVPEEEMKAWQSDGDRDKRISDAAAAIDAACLFDERLRYNRARSLLAMFLHEIEGPGLRRNGVTIPCMDVDFLSKEEWDVLLETEDKDAKGEAASDTVAIDNSAKEAIGEAENRPEESPRPSLHPITIDAIEEAFRLRAQNSTTSPLRLIDAQSEWFEVQYSIVKFADRFLEQYSKASGKSNNDGEDIRWTEEELQTVGGRIVGTLMRLDDLEWEWNHRICSSSLAELAPDSWKTTLGLLPDNVEQRCVRTLDEALLDESEFARARAERMLALFLLNIESPGLKAAGEKVPGGSHPDFIEDALQLELMMPRPKTE
ncbi:hypothetical protein ACHAXT_004114 [Thalassiosira profunda]